MTKTGPYSIRSVLQIVTGNPVDAMEAAKEIIRSRKPPSTVWLEEIAGNTSCRKWSRIAAVHALGFLGSKATSPVLIRILQSAREHPQLRAHAAEALGNLRESRALPSLRRILMSKERTDLKKWSIYAASEIGGPKARAILNQFAATNATRVLKKELKAALARK
jgi:HEAT repeat protein